MESGLKEYDQGETLDQWSQVLKNMIKARLTISRVQSQGVCYDQGETHDQWSPLSRSTIKVRLMISAV